MALRIAKLEMEMREGFPLCVSIKDLAMWLAFALAISNISRGGV